MIKCSRQSKGLIVDAITGEVEASFAGQAFVSRYADRVALVSPDSNGLRVLQINDDGQ